MAGITKLINGNIIDKSNEKVDLNDEKYQGKLIGLYFTAHWCPPCRGFTPILTEFYKNYHEEKNFEIIFISSDQDEKSFNEYYNEMPWLALDYNDRKTKEELGNKFHVTGIPKLIFLDVDSGDIVCEDGRQQVQSIDPEGKDFPWKSEK
ncbi:hypothetical protein I4U23_021708 [Adineta vaga]|nr:hypothetical protein I4U23_021708 [Adineta vaga]